MKFTWDRKSYNSPLILFEALTEEHWVTELFLLFYYLGLFPQREMLRIEISELWYTLGHHAATEQNVSVGATAPWLFLPRFAETQRSHLSLSQLKILIKERKIPVPSAQIPRHQAVRQSAYGPFLYPMLILGFVHRTERMISKLSQNFLNHWYGEEFKTFGFGNFSEWQRNSYNSPYNLF